MSCHFCGGAMIWGGDFDFEDYGMEGDGIVANLTCSDCGAYAEFYSNVDREESSDGDKGNSE